jgi:hypothetical protein
MSEEWMTKQSCTLGLVTGATDVAALKRIRELAPSAWFLCPGVGAQGGSAEVLRTLSLWLILCLECLWSCLEKGWERSARVSVSRNL